MKPQTPAEFPPDMLKLLRLLSAVSLMGCLLVLVLIVLLGLAGCLFILVSVA